MLNTPPRRSFTRSWSLGSALVAVLFVAGCGGDNGAGYNPRPTDWPDAAVREPTVTLATYITELKIPGVSGGVPECCFDFGKRSQDFIEDGDDGFDNALANLAGPISSFFDFQTALDAGIEDGSQAIVLRHVDLPEGDGKFRVEAIRAEFDGATTYAEASDGDGTFKIKRGKSPISMTAEVEDGRVTIGPASFALTVPFGDIPVDLTLRDARLTGDAFVLDDGIAYESGTLSGYIPIADVFAGFNAYAKTECSCLGVSGNLFTKNGKMWESACVADAATLCPDNSICVSLGGADLVDEGELCSLLPGMLMYAADINMDADTSDFEAISVGLEWLGAPATLNK